MREVIQVSKSEFSLTTSGDISRKIKSLAKQLNLKERSEDKCPLIGYKIVTIVNGNPEDIKVFIKLLKSDYRVKIL